PWRAVELANGDDRYPKFHRQSLKPARERANFLVTGFPARSLQELQIVHDQDLNALVGLLVLTQVAAYVRKRARHVVDDQRTRHEAHYGLAGPLVVRLINSWS